MSNTKSKVEIKKIRIEPIGTHNSIAPFTSKIKRGIEAEITAITISGTQSEPKIYVGGCTHGDELNGVVAVLKLIKVIQEHELQGTVILVPIQNPVAFEYRERLNPFDPIDPDWVHPGKADGTYSQKMKHALTSFSKDADCVIDLHTSGRGGLNNPMIYVPPETGNGAGQRSLELAKCFGGDRLVFGDDEAEYDWPVKFTMPFAAVREGRMGLYAEAGMGGSSIPEPKFVDYFVTGVLNIMIFMGMIKGNVTKQGERVIIQPDKTELGIVSPSEGIFMPTVSIGEKIKSGALLAELWSLDGLKHSVIAPSEGLISFMNQFGAVGAGDRLFTISP